MPRDFLMERGIDPARDFDKVSVSGAHGVTVRWGNEARNSRQNA